MAPLSDLLSHASASVERSRHSLARLRASLDAERANMSRQRRCCVEGALVDLARRHSFVVDTYREMARAGNDALPQLWQRFLICYDDYMEALRNAKCELAREEYLEDVDSKAQAENGDVVGRLS